MKVSSLDHLVLTVKNLEATCTFYSQALGMEIVSFQNDRKSLKFGNSKINLHEHGHEFDPKANYPTPGSADLCFLTDTPIQEVIRHLIEIGVNIIEGPVQRTGAKNKLLSVYVRDPDDNLVEISNEIVTSSF
jgi:catechol 2,3-dioxygenase-like lactoylglutathione lyase family enzyme